MLSLKEKLSYSFGTCGYNIQDTLISTYLVLFATDVMGLSPGIVGVILLVPKITDIISDFFLMNYIDKTRTRFGTYRPWAFSGVAYGILTWLLFCYPSFLKTNVQKLAWIAIIYFFAVTIFETIYWCSHATLKGIITPDENERTSLVGLSSLFEAITGLVCAATIFPLLSNFGTGYKDSYAWKNTVLIFVSIGMLSCIVLFLGIRERVQINKEENALSIKEKTKIIISNKKLLIVNTIVCLSFLSLYMYITISSYYIIYNLNHEDWYSYYSLISVIFAILSSIIVPRIRAKHGYKKTILFASVILVVSSLIMALWCDQYIFILFIALRNFGIEGCYICAISYISTISDEMRKKDKDMLPGTIFGFSSSLQKVTITLGSFISTQILQFGGYDSSLPNQCQFTLNSIRFGIALTYFIAGLLIFTLAKRLKDDGNILA